MTDRSDWNRGPWDNEPDEHDFIDGTTSYPCALRRNSFGAWCGYVGVPDGTPLHGKGYGDEIPGAEIDPETRVDEVGIVTAFVHAGLKKTTLDVLVRCHGGLTYADKPWWPDEKRATWFFGFDCSHRRDACPQRRVYSSGGTYRDMAYVIDCCKKAASDLARAAKA